MLTLAPCVLATLLSAPPAVEPLTPDRIQDLIKKLEVPTRSQKDQKPGPPDYPWPTFDYRWHSAEIAELKRAGEAAVPALLSLLADKSKPGQARAHAAMILIERLVGTKVKPDPKIIAAINAALKDKDPALRYGVLDRLIPYGAGENRRYRQAILKTIGGPELSRNWAPFEEMSFAPAVMDEFLPHILPLLADEHPEIAIHAAKAIDWFGRPKCGVRELLAALKRKEPEVRVAAARVLSQVGKGDPDVATAVIGQIDPKLPILLYATVIRSVGRFGPDAKAAVPQLIQALKDNRKDPTGGSDLGSLHDAAACALGAIGPDAKDAIPALLSRLETKYYPADASATEYYLGNKSEVVAALERIDPTVGKKAGAEHNRRLADYFQWQKSPPPMPTLPLESPR